MSGTESARVKDMAKVYDKTGREIMAGDILKVFHFVGSRRKHHYMYKQAIGVVMLGKDNPSPFLHISHLDMTGDSYHQLCDGRVLPDYEIVQSATGWFEDRPRITPNLEPRHD